MMCGAADMVTMCRPDSGVNCDAIGALVDTANEVPGTLTFENMPGRDYLAMWPFRRGADVVRLPFCPCCGADVSLGYVPPEEDRK